MLKDAKTEFFFTSVKIWRVVGPEKTDSGRELGASFPLEPMHKLGDTLAIGYLEKSKAHVVRIITTIPSSPDYNTPLDRIRVRDTSRLQALCLLSIFINKIRF